MRKKSAIIHDAALESSEIRHFAESVAQGCGRDSFALRAGLLKLCRWTRFFHEAPDALNGYLDECDYMEKAVADSIESSMEFWRNQTGLEIVVDVEHKCVLVNAGGRWIAAPPTRPDVPF